jgi:hypothetical protein
MYNNLLLTIQKEPSTNKKKALILSYCAEHPLLKDILYLGLSKRIRFYIKQISDYINIPSAECTIQSDLEKLKAIYTKEITGNAAREYLLNILESSSEPDLIEKIVLKDLKIGLGRTEINKVFPNLIEKPPYMGGY